MTDEMYEALLRYGKEFVALLGLKHGDKVLDMGCGSGDITAFIADQVGEEGFVLGVDPDEKKIKVAVEKYGKGSIDFMAGDSCSQFPHCNGEYYDVFFISFVLHVLTAEEKSLLLKTALKCLKPKGRIAIHSHEKMCEVFEAGKELLPVDELAKNRFLIPNQLIKKSDLEAILVKSGFDIEHSEYFDYLVLFKSVKELLRYFFATINYDESKVLPEKKEGFVKKFGGEASVVVNMTTYQVIAKKL